MDIGEVDAYPEVWMPNFHSLVKKYVEGKKTVRLSPNAVAATQGICVTRETADKHGIKDISDLTDPAKAAVFDTDGDGKGDLDRLTDLVVDGHRAASAPRAMATPRR